MAFWKSRVWLVYNPEQTDLETIRAFTDDFLQFYHSCGSYVEKRNSLIELYIPRDISCAMLTATGAASTSIDYENGSQLRNIVFELDSAKLSVNLWWSRTRYGDFSYSLQLFDLQGARVGPQSDAVITDIGFYAENLDLSSLPAGEYALKLIVYNAQSLEGQPGIIVGPQQSFQRDVEVGRFKL